MNDDIVNIVVMRFIKHGTTLDELDGLVRLLKAAGIDRERIIAAVEAARAAAPTEETEDVVLEVLDFVTGFCQKHRRIF